MKTFRLFIYFLIVLSASCTAFSPENDLAGTYKVTERSCTGSEYQRQTCADIKLIEIVRGHFYKIKDHEHAFVLWSGESDLNYNARRLDQRLNGVTYPFGVTIDSDGTYLEKLIFTSPTEGRYMSGKGKDLSVLVFKKASKQDLSIYTKEYPGND